MYICHIYIYMYILRLSIYLSIYLRSMNIIYMTYYLRVYVSTHRVLVTNLDSLLNIFELFLAGLDGLENMRHRDQQPRGFSWDWRWKVPFSEAQSGVWILCQKFNFSSGIWR
jgi:hypothetical protein